MHRDQINIYTNIFYFILSGGVVGSGGDEVLEGGELEVREDS